MARPLAPRLQEILDLKCRCDLSHKEIGARLGINEQTVKNHVTRLLDLYGCRSMHATCFAYGQERGDVERERTRPKPVDY
jgi:DNA-binding NarL/FixJ family response regulator